MRNETQRQNVTLFNLSWDSNFYALHISAIDYESIMCIDQGVTNNTYKVGEFANVESMNNADGCIYNRLMKEEDITLCPFTK